MKFKKFFVLAVVLMLAAILIISRSGVVAQGPEPQNASSIQAVQGNSQTPQNVLNPQSPAGGGGPGQVSSNFSYQGQLKSSNAPVNGNCDFVFSLWNQSGSGQPPSGGVQIGSTQTQTNVLVTNGLFNVVLGFGDAFQGNARWLQIAVRCPAGSVQAYTTLGPRQPLWATPYALSLRPGASVIGNQANWNTIYASNVATTSYSYGIRSQAYAPWGRGVSGESGAAGGMGVYGYSVADGGAGVAGYIGGNNLDVYTFGSQQYGVYGKSESTDGIGVMGLSGAALITDTHPAILTFWKAGGEFAGRNGLIAAASSEGGGQGHGVIGIAKSGGNGIGVYGLKLGGGNYAGYFSGNVHVTGNLSAGGAKPFKIDNPLDPANQYLYHYAVESPQVQNVYNGTAALDAKGEAVVNLPAYFSAVNTGDYRYYLTAIGAPMPNLYIAEEIQGNTFKIAGGVAGKKVSWMVYGLRNDPWLRDNPQRDIVDKPGSKAGTYVYPQGYGQPENAGESFGQAQPGVPEQP